MRNLPVFAATLFATSLCYPTPIIALPATAPKYIFHVIVDDLGWGDVGFHRSPPSPEVQTPNMDALVAEGVHLERHYVHSMCTPSRSAFFSGRLPVHVQNSLANPETPTSGVSVNMTFISARMKEAGYKTHITGKWDAGMVSLEKSEPTKRGFDTSLIYYEHKNSYWDQTLMQSNCQQYNPIVDLWDTGAPAKTLNGTGYEEYIFRDRVFTTINNHDMNDPLFLVYTPHVAHCPLQVPQDVLAQFNFADDESDCQQQTPYIFPGSQPSDYRCRSQYSAMVSLLDGILGNLTGLLKSRGMWEDTLMVLTADNGAPSATSESGASSWPLRGGKYSFFEGGVRASAFVSGGFLPEAVRGTNQSGIISIADWYRTFCELAGVDPTDYVAAQAGLPPIDSLNVWPLLSGANTTSPRTEIPLTNNVLLQNQYKLMLGNQEEATWGGPQFPNASSVNHTVDPGPIMHCGATGCLFDVVADPTEHNDIAAQYPEIVASMTLRLTELVKGFYTNNDTGFTMVCPPNITMECACWAALNVWGGYFGPYAL